MVKQQKEKVKFTKATKATMKLHVQYPLLQSTNDKTWRIQSLNKKDTTFSTNYYKSCSCKASLHNVSCVCTHVFMYIYGYKLTLHNV